MRYIRQSVCVVAIAIGGGRFAYGGYLVPLPDPANPMDASHSFNVDRHTREVASAGEYHFTADVHACRLATWHQSRLKRIQRAMSSARLLT
jgi:hypothetical protein